MKHGLMTTFKEKLKLCERLSSLNNGFDNVVCSVRIKSLCFSFQVYATPERFLGEPVFRYKLVVYLYSSVFTEVTQSENSRFPNESPVALELFKVLLSKTELFAAFNLLSKLDRMIKYED